MSRFTTSSTAKALPFRSNRTLHVFIAIFAAVWIWSVVRPAIPEDWLLENLLVFAGAVFAYNQREMLIRKAGLRGGWLYSLPILGALALSAAYEIIEAVVASIVDPADAAAFLGSQGDQWDSQEDMFMGLVGASVCMLTVALQVSRKTKSIVNQAAARL